MHEEIQVPSYMLTAPKRIFEIAVGDSRFATVGALGVTEELTPILYITENCFDIQSDSAPLEITRLSGQTWKVDTTSTDYKWTPTLRATIVAHGTVTRLVVK